MKFINFNRKVGWGIIAVIVILAAIATGVYLVKKRQELEGRARLEAGMRVSHLDCQELLVVLPGAPEGLDGSGGEAVIVVPSGSQVRVNLTWRGYDGPVAKWEAGAQSWYAGRGIYIVVSASGADFTAQNTPQEYTLTCGEEAPTPTVTQPPDLTPTASPTQIPDPPTPTPTGVLTPTPTGTGGDDPVPTPTPTPEPTSVPSATPVPAATATPTTVPPSPTSSLLSDSGENDVTPAAAAAVPVSGETGPTALFLIGGVGLVMLGWWLWRVK